MLNNKFIFAILVVVLGAAIVVAVMYQPARSSEGQSADNASIAPLKLELQADAPVGLQVGNLAPSWTLKDPAGNTHRLEDYLGQVVIMDFWATWCGPCRMVMPDLQKLHESYASRNVHVLGMNGSERGGDPVQFMANNNYTYATLLHSETIMNLYGVQGIPMVYVIGVDGTILHKHVGYSQNLYDELVNVIDPHLKAHKL